LPGGQPVSDTRRLLRYFRLDPEGRLLMGGRGSFDGENRPQRYERLRRAAQRVFPQLGEPDWQFFWSGKVALTADQLPHIHEPKPGVLAGLGYNGRGVAMASRMGKLLADYVSGASAETLGFPITPHQAPALQVRCAGRYYAALINSGNRLRDWFGTEGLV
jgi:glycine/D-amino acid oxidase-like deaminating enzyme